jgi:putative endonuclease
VQVHGFASQGYAYSNENNFLTMNTSHGSPAMTEGALNLSMPVTDKFRVGGQGYTRKIGSLDDFKPQLDWAYGDYKFAGWFGVRAGKVKTAMGLYNDTQDMDFLHTWALLPQGVYPADLRTTLIAHTGGDLYGRIRLKKAGKLDYTAYAGTQSFDPRGGLYLFTADNGFSIQTVNGHTEGWDLKWTTPVKGLMLGSSWANNTMLRYGAWISGPLLGVKYTNEETPEMLWVGYGSYNQGKWEFNADLRLLPMKPRMVGDGMAAMGWMAQTRIAWLERSLAGLNWVANRRGQTGSLPAHLATGIEGEDAAFFYLRRKGYIVAARRWSSGNVPGDLDLVAWQGPLLCIVEVKTRTAHDIAAAEVSVDSHKRHTLRRLARQYVRQLPQESTPPVRFDVISVYLVPGEEKEFVHFEGSFGWSEQRNYEDRYSS